MELPSWVATSVDHARSAASRLKGTSAPVPWLRVGGLSALTIAGLAVAASSAQVSGQAVVPVPVPIVSAATVQADVGELNLVTVMRPPTQYRIAPSAAIAPPPPGIVMAPGGLGIPKIALEAYQNAEKMMAKAAPGCGVSWNLLAGIGRIESGHANNGATDAKGRVVQPIYGPSLDGTLPGNEVIVDHEQTRTQGAQVYVRAIGPMQFLPSTWSRYASDGDGDGKADPQNVFDATYSAGRYLCAGVNDIMAGNNAVAAVFRYNHSMAYVTNVLAWAGAYSTGVMPTQGIPDMHATPVDAEKDKDKDKNKKDPKKPGDDKPGDANAPGAEPKTEQPGGQPKQKKENCFIVCLPPELGGPKRAPAAPKPPAGADQQPKAGQAPKPGAPKPGAPKPGTATKPGAAAKPGGAAPSSARTAPLR